MSTTQYPPIAAPTMDQEFLSAAGVTVHPSQYKTLDFSPLFLSIYGRPTITYRAWARLWSIEASHILEGVCRKYPSSSSNFLGFAGYKDRYLEFCMEVDSYFGRLGEGGKRGGGNGRDARAEGSLQPVGRAEMEGAWIKVLVGMFEEMRGKRDLMRGFVGMRFGKGDGRILMTIREVEGEMRNVLREAVEQRFGKEAEEYWARKWKVYGYRCPALDVKCITDWSVEAPFQKSLLKPEDINDNDYDENDDHEGDDSGVAMDGVETTQETKQKMKQEPKQEPNPNPKREINSQASDEPLSTKQNMKQEMKLEESDTLHGSFAFREQEL
ncbi:hypothetical protein NHQ30_001603 [Ciborinia camelliae]|nr:hypothetical protein NHQ30_001603 [Ciborinia camelliae]